jgi:hypothetical protein
MYFVVNCGYTVFFYICFLNVSAVQVNRVGFLTSKGVQTVECFIISESAQELTP